MPLAKNQLHTVHIEGYTSEGEGVARIEGQVVFVKAAIQGETCEIRILRSTKNIAWAKIETLISPSPHRIEPLCPAFGPCGGCDFLHMSYEEELRAKEQRVTDALTRVGGLDIPTAPIIGADQQTHYRNKAIFAVGAGPATGFYRRRSHQIIPVTNCLIQAKSANRAASALREWMSAYDIPAYDETTKKGLIRHLFIRVGRDALGAPEKSAVCIVATAAKLPNQTELIETLRRHCPEASGILLCVNRDPGNVVLQGDFRTLWGEDTLTDTLCGLDFRLSPRSFFQINPPQAERLYEKARAYAGLTGAETLLDLYCGTGTITLIMAKDAKHAIGAEIVAPAIADAKENARANGIENAEFLLGDAGEAAKQLETRGVKPDVIILDPPRKGLAPEVVTQVVKLAPKRVVYVSCDPATLARDLGRFAEQGYQAKELTPVDMFPRCAHVEAVVWMQRQDS